MHLAMLPQGQWHDEFYTFSFLRARGLHGALTRLVNWGPRPFSELLILIYWHAVRASGGPLMSGVLGASWAMMWAGLLAALRPWRRPGRGARWALALGLPALFLMAGPVAELWYWPVGALAYMPALGAAGYVTLVLAGPGVTARRDWVWLAAALGVGAWSVEVGMFLAVVLAPLLAVSLWRTDRRSAVIMLVPLAAGLLVAAGLAHGRTAQANEMVDAGTFHRIWPSLRAGWPVFAAGLTGWGDDGSPHLAGMRALAVRGLLLLGAWAGLRLAWPAPVSRVRLAMVIVALGSAALLSAVGAFYQFGVLCCERHEAYRQAIYLLMIVAAAGLLPRAGQVLGRAGLAAPRPSNSTAPAESRKLNASRVKKCTTGSAPASTPISPGPTSRADRSVVSNSALAAGSRRRSISRPGKVAARAGRNTASAPASTTMASTSPAGGGAPPANHQTTSSNSATARSKSAAAIARRCSQLSAQRPASSAATMPHAACSAER